MEESLSWAWFTNGGSPGGKIASSYFSIRNNGKPVSINGDKGSSYFWQAWFLKDAPKTTILAGSQSMYLITEENGKSKIVPVNEQDNNFGKIQWLDSENGQPGKQREIYNADASNTPGYLSGGQFLFINTKVVLDIQTLKSYQTDVNSSELVTQLDDYNPFDSRAVAMSPDKSQLVLIGTRRNPVSHLSQYALITIDFVKNKAYAVPFDRTETRFSTIWDASSEWVNTYFHWITNANGSEILQKRWLELSPYWIGRWTIYPPDNIIQNYQLVPVRKDIVKSLVDFVKLKYPPVEIETREQSPQTINYLTINKSRLGLYFNSANQTLSLESENKELLKEIGEKFDHELRKGRFQNDFGKFEVD
ncbi:hypothetical protein [Dyadobacter frigoris]|uniref:Uncharacterized protein n=1 Tax=Dyadobacter frigoris TaxID=2576211 RepID=A0A4U6CZR6_9BACT|nr:hypothetical protein [Dyadobacter frigoris]TKT88898.1 hypothetical protein FDK13_25000 [Dyadobacter frigoris]